MQDITAGTTTTAADSDSNNLELAKRFLTRFQTDCMPPPTFVKFRYPLHICAWRIESPTRTLLPTTSTTTAKTEALPLGNDPAAFKPHQLPKLLLDERSKRPQPSAIHLLPNDADLTCQAVRDSLLYHIKANPSDFRVVPPTRDTTLEEAACVFTAGSASNHSVIALNQSPPWEKDHVDSRSAPPLLLLVWIFFIFLSLDSQTKTSSHPILGTPRPRTASTGYATGTGCASTPAMRPSRNASSRATSSTSPAPTRRSSHGSAIIMKNPNPNHHARPKPSGASLAPRSHSNSVSSMIGPQPIQPIGISRASPPSRAPSRPGSSRISSSSRCHSVMMPSSSTAITSPCTQTRSPSRFSSSTRPLRAPPPPRSRRPRFMRTCTNTPPTTTPSWSSCASPCFP